MSICPLKPLLYKLSTAKSFDLLNPVRGWKQVISPEPLKKEIAVSITHNPARGWKQETDSLVCLKILPFQ
nr:hypothetical protein [Hyella patelloides]